MSEEKTFNPLERYPDSADMHWLADNYKTVTHIHLKEDGGQLCIQHAGNITVTFAAIGSLIKQVAESSGRSFGDVFVEAMMCMILESKYDNQAFERDPLKTVTDQAVSEVKRLVDYGVKNTEVDRKDYVSAIINALAEL